MKTIIKLIFLGIVVAVTWQYLENNNINVAEKIEGSAEWLKARMKEFESTPPPVISQSDEPYETERPESESLTNAGSGDNYQAYNSIVTGSTWGDPAPSYQESAEEVPEEVSSDEAVEWVKAATKKYSPDSWYMLMEYDELPARAEAKLTNGTTSESNKPAGTFSYLRGSGRTEIILSMSTNVHEIGHGYYHQNVFRYANENNLQLDWDNADGFIYLSQGKSFYLSFPAKYLFPSAELKASIPVSLRTFRFDTYIDGNTSTQEDGVLGLLNEMHAYFLGSRFTYDMLDAYKSAEASESDGLIEWVSSISSEMTAFYEFDFFIKEYLFNMKSNYPDSYKQLKAYRNFSLAYAEVRKYYTDLINSYQERVDSEIRKINASGSHEAHMEGVELWIKSTATGRSRGSDIFYEDRMKLLPVLESIRYNEIISDFL